MVGEHFDACNEVNDVTDEAKGKANRFLGVTFACCSVYQRVYLSARENAYIGRCPKCHRQVKIPVGPGGSDSRFFTAY